MSAGPDEDSCDRVCQMRLFSPAALAALNCTTKCIEAELPISSGKATQERTD